MTSTPERTSTPRDSQLETPDLSSQLSPGTLDEIESVRKLVQPSDLELQSQSGPTLNQVESVEIPDLSGMSGQTESDAPQETPELEKKSKTSKPPLPTYKKPKSSFPEFVKDFAGKLYPDYDKVEEYQEEYEIPLITWQYRGSTLTPPKLPVGHALQRYGFITSMANISHEVTWSPTIHSDPIVVEVVSAATLSQVILDNRYVIRTLGEREDDNEFDLNFKMVLPINPMDVIRAERKLICEPENEKFKLVYDKIPFIPLQFELPWIEFPENFVFKFKNMTKIRPTEFDYLTYFLNYSNIRFNGVTYAANCRHPTSHWDEHPWCVSCMVIAQIARCSDVFDDEEESCCPYCFVMGPVALKNRLTRWIYWENKVKTEHITEMKSNRLQTYIRHQFDADLQSKTCDYNPDWDNGYFGYCRPSWAIPIFMSWQEYWFVTNNGVDLLEKVNYHRDIFRQWSYAHINRSPNRCEFQHFPAFIPLTELPTATKAVTQAIPVPFDPELSISKKRKRTQSRPSSAERASKSRPLTPDPSSQSDATLTPGRRSKSQSLDSHSHFLRTRNDTVDYTFTEQPFGFELKGPELTPTKPEVTLKFVSALEFISQTQTQASDSAQNLVVDSPSRALISTKSPLKTKTETETEAQVDADVQTQRQYPEFETVSTIVTNSLGTFRHEVVTTGGPHKLPIIDSFIPIALSTPKAADLSSTCSLNLTSSTPENPTVIRVTKAPGSPLPVTTQSGNAGSPDIVTPHRTDVSLTCHSTLRPSPPTQSGDGVVLTSQSETTQHLVFHPAATNFKVISQSTQKVRTALTSSAQEIITSPVVNPVNRSLDAGTPLSRVWTSRNPGLTYPTQDLTQDVKALRLLSVESVAGLKNEEPLREFEGEIHEGEDVILDDMEEYPIHAVSLRFKTKIDQTLEYYSNSAYAPSFPPSLFGNTAGCSPYGLTTNVREPIRSRAGSFPVDANSMSMLQSEGVRLEANSRLLGKMAENEAYLMPALINFVNDKKDKAESGSDELGHLNSLVNGLRLNMKMREDLVAENLGIITAVRRRDNIERISTIQGEIDHFVSRNLADEDPNLLPTKKK